MVYCVILFSAAAYSLGNNFAWFIGLILSVLILIALSTYIVLMYKKHPEPKRKQYTGMFSEDIMNNDK